LEQRTVEEKKKNKKKKRVKKGTSVNDFLTNVKEEKGKTLNSHSSPWKKKGGKVGPEGKEGEGAVFAQHQGEGEKDML